MRPKDKPVACEVRLWEAATGRELRRLTPPVERAGTEGARLAFSADGQSLYLGATSGRFLRWVERFGWSSRLDLLMLKQVLAHLQTHDQSLDVFSLHQF